MKALLVAAALAALVVLGLLVWQGIDGAGSQPRGPNLTSGSAPAAGGGLATPAMPSSSPLPWPAGSACVTSSHSGTCGAYPHARITNSNGFNTYVGNNMWACGPDSDVTSCGPQTLTAHGPGSWSVISNQTAGNTGVRTYPNTQQLFNNWTGSGWNGGGAMTDTPIARLASLSSSYAETMPYSAGIIAQAAWDIWLSGTTGPNEIMVWVDNVNRGSGGAEQKGSTTVNGQEWTLYQYGDGELIWSLGAPGTFARQPKGTVDLLALLRWLISHGFVPPGAAIGQIQFGWEVCSTGGRPETFTVSAYSISAVSA